MKNHSKVSQHKVVGEQYVVSGEDKNLSSPFTPFEIQKLKDLIYKSYIIYPDALRKNGLMYWCVSVCKYYNISIDEFKTKRRDQYLVNARRDFCHLAKQHTIHSMTHIGNFMNKHHTSVLHHLNKKPINAEKIYAETHDKIL